ncbi:efflux RND transporter permease subunit, partial [Arthrospira platensis SPKY1]|nr:efflux RND transporter permease subunit [Arthrospira platensis SPKY1]
SLADIRMAVEQANLFSATGQLQDGYYRYALHIESRIRDLDDLHQTPIKTLANGRVLRLADVAEIKLAPDDPLSFARFNSDEVVAVLVKKTPNANTVDVVADVQKQLAALQ